MRSLVVVLAVWLPLQACTYASGDSRVLVTSEPAGAEIWIDGEYSGETTPSMIDLGGIFAPDHVITLKKAGYDPAVRHVTHWTTFYTSRWIDGADLTVWSIPLWWTLGDWFTPFAVKWQYVPHDIYAVLYPEGTGPVPLDGPDR